MKTSLNLLSILAIMLASCAENIEPSFTYIDAMAFISIKDRSGKNLLDPASERSFDHQKIKIFYKRETKWVEFYNPDLNWPRNFYISKRGETGEYVFGAGLETETLIQWNESESDTLITEFYHFPSNDGFRVNKIHHEGVLVYDYDATGGKEATFTIIK